MLPCGSLDEGTGSCRSIRRISPYFFEPGSTSISGKWADRINARVSCRLPIIPLRRYSKKNASKGVQSVAVVDLRGNRTPDLFHAKEAVGGRGFSAVSAAFVQDPLPGKPRRDSRLHNRIRPVFACQAIPKQPAGVRR